MTTQQLANCSKDINVEYMGFGTLKQHSEKHKHRGQAYVDPADEGKSKQSVLYQYFVVKTPQSTVAKETSSSSSHDNVWTVKQSATKAEISATLQFAAHNVPLCAAEKLVAYYQQQFPDSLIAKNVSIG